MAIVIDRYAHSRLVAEAADADPLECCGILLGHEGRIDAIQPATNVHPAPQTHFEIDPQALIDAHRSAREGGLAVLGYYHSHPNGLAEPSATDRRMAAGDGAIWAIVAGEAVTLWRASPEGFLPLSYTLPNA